VIFHRNGCDLPQPFHTVDDKGYDRKVKHPRWRVEMERQFGFVSEVNMEFELIEVDFYGLFGFIVHFFASTGFLNRGVI
jgi:hypothetical protein